MITLFLRDLSKKLSLFVFVTLFFLPSSSFAFPIYAQQAYENPREANGRIVCANCHLAQKSVEIEAPSAVLPDTVFESIVKIPYDKTKQQLLATGQKGGLNVGAVVILPESCFLSPQQTKEESFKNKNKRNLYYSL
jgi:apocytochrome f